MKISFKKQKYQQVGIFLMQVFIKLWKSNLRGKSPAKTDFSRLPGASYETTLC
jgi:hypothetical protein